MPFPNSNITDLLTEIGNLSEGTLSREHAEDIANYIEENFVTDPERKYPPHSRRCNNKHCRVSSYVAYENFSNDSAHMVCPSCKQKGVDY